MNKKRIRWNLVGGGVGALIAGIALMFGATQVVYPAISQLVGLAVAQSATLWNNVIDAAKGDGLANGLLGQVGYVWNGLTFDRSKEATADGVTAVGLPAIGNEVLNGTTWDRLRGVSATNNTATTSVGTSYTTQLSTWSIIDTDAGATQSTISKTAGGGTVRHVATSITICRGDTAVAVPALAHLRDGATGAGTILRSWVIGVSVANETKCENLSGLNITGTANTAMTIEFAAAGSATSTSTVSLTGYSTP